MSDVELQAQLRLHKRIADLEEAADRVLKFARFKFGELVGYDQHDEALTALFDLYQTRSEQRTSEFAQQGDVE